MSAFQEMLAAARTSSGYAKRALATVHGFGPSSPERAAAFAKESRDLANHARTLAETAVDREAADAVAELAESMLAQARGLASPAPSASPRMR